MARKRYRFMDVVLTNNTTGVTLESTMLDGRSCLQRRNFRSDNQVP